MQSLLAVNAQGLSACSGLAIAGGSCANGGGFLGYFAIIANTLVFLVGAIAVIMVIIGALRYVLSNGDAAGIKGAKDTITYALIGVVVSLLAYAMVTFIIGRFK